jgi:hypothetical protein
MKTRYSPLDPHPSVTEKRLERLYMEEDANEANLGICIQCGAERFGVEPDAERYRCERCKLPGVYGIETLMLLLAGW